MTGQSPAIIVETVWALAFETPAIIPSRVVCITTTTGRTAIVKDILGPSSESSVWGQLRVALLRKGVQINGKLQLGSTSDDIRVVTARHPKTEAQAGYSVTGLMAAAI